MPRTKKEVISLDPETPVVPKKRGRPRKNPPPESSPSSLSPTSTAPQRSPVPLPGGNSQSSGNSQSGAATPMPVARPTSTAARQTSTQWPMPQVTWPGGSSGTTRTTSTFVRGPDGANRLVSSETRNGQQFPQIPDATCILETLQLLSREPILDTLLRLRREPCDRPGCT